jgi:PTS system galactitol-specific IIA component
MSQFDDEGLEGLTLRDENILVQAKADSREEIIRQLGSLLFEHGLVKDTFVQAVLDREKAYPTGLQTNILGFAIPHTDTEHVNSPALAIATLSQPVVFQAMGDPDTSVSVSVVMMLAISDPKAVVHVLRKVISILEDSDALTGLLGAASREEIKRIVHNHIQKVSDDTSKESSTVIPHV